MASEQPLSQILLRRIQRDYEEPPELRHTPQRARRLWGLDRPTCGAALASLAGAGLLQRLPDRRFVRRRSKA